MTQNCKVGFHTGLGGNHKGIGIYMRQMDKAGIPFCLKSVDDVSLVTEAAELASSSGVAHNVLLRFSRPGGAADDRPRFDGSPKQSAEAHWERVVRSLSNTPIPERFKEQIWIEPTNQLDEWSQSDFLGWFSYHLGQAANKDGYKVALAGHSIGYPELERWRLPGYQAYLRACAERPDMLAVSLQEGKQGDMELPVEMFYPHATGRFTWLYDACDELGISRPTTFISKWAWCESDMPSVERAMQDVHWLSELAAKYQTLRGLFLWSLAEEEDTPVLSKKLQKLIGPVTEYALQAQFPDPLRPTRRGGIVRRTRALTSRQAVDDHALDLPNPISSEGTVEDSPLPSKDRGKPRVQYPRFYVLLPPKARHEWVSAVTEATWERFGYTVGKSPDDAGVGDLDRRTVIAVNPSEWGPGEDGQGLEGFFASHYPGVAYNAVEAKTPAHLKRLLAALGPNDMIEQAG